MKLLSCIETDQMPRPSLHQHRANRPRFARNGSAPSESFHPGAEGWKALDMPTRNEILELFPQLANGDFDSYGPSARASLKHKEGSLLSHSMISQTQH